MWLIKLVRKLRTFKILKLVQKIRELRERLRIVGLGRRKMMRRTIRGAQAGFRRFTQFQMWIIKLADALKRAGLVVPPSDLSSSTKNGVGGEKGMRNDTAKDELLEYGLDDDLDVISLDALSNYWDHHHQHQNQQRTRSHSQSHHSSRNTRTSRNSPKHSPRNSRNFDEDQQQQHAQEEEELDQGLEASEEIFSSESYSIPLGSPGSGSACSSGPSSPSSYSSSSSSSSIFSQIMRIRKTSTTMSNEVRESPLRNNNNNNNNNNSDDDYQVTKQMDKSSTFSSFPSHHHKSPRHSRTRRHRRRRRQNQSHEFTEEQTSHRSAFLDFLFEDSPSPSRFLTTQALQNILGCPSCSEQTMSILPKDIRPCEQSIEDYSDLLPAVELGIEIGSGNGKCLLCECSYGETKSLLLEKLAMRSWLRPCKYQKYGCPKIVGIGVQFDDLGHSEEQCKFAPILCPFMLCRRKFPKEGLLINHLCSEHHLNPHSGPKSFETEGTIFCLGNNRRLGGKHSRANYSMDPCALYFHGNMFILRILRHGGSWYIWVWTLKGGEENSATIDRKGVREIPAGQENGCSETEKFPYTIRFRRQSTSQPPANLVVKGFTVSVRYSMEEIMEKGLCLQIMEQGSLFDCSEEKNDNSLVVDFKLVIQPPPPPQPNHQNHHNSNSRTATTNNRLKSQPAAITTRYRKKSH